jgi:ParB-like chromosome segregation protein Spo0J
MRLKKIAISDIQFTYQEYDTVLLQSVQRIGLSFPIKVKVMDDHYICSDGHKRLSVLQDLLKEEIHTKQVNCIVINDGSSRSNDCWRDRNTH